MAIYPNWLYDPETEEVFDTVASTCRGFEPWQVEAEMFDIKSLRTPVSYWGTDLELPTLFEKKSVEKKHPSLTDADTGLFRQVTERNLSELSAFLIDAYEFAEIGGRLAVYRNPCWRFLTPQGVRKELATLLEAEKSACYVSPKQLNEIAIRILNASAIRHLERLPPVDYHVLCCRDDLYYWPDDKILRSSSHNLRFGHLEVDARDIAPSSTPFFDTFLDGSTQGDIALRQLILEVIGIIVTGYPVKSFFVFEGPTDSGKSQLARLLKGILGESSCFAINDVNQLGGQWTPGMLPGKLLCLCSDVPDRPLSAKTVGAIKQLTGDDLIHGEQKYQPPFVFLNTAKLLFLTNFPLRVSGHQQDEAFFRRMVRVPFRYSVPKNQQIPRLFEQLLNEAGGIIWLALQAMKDFEARGDVFTAVEDNQEQCITALEPTEADLLTNFIKSRCVLDPVAAVSVRTLYYAYCQYVRTHYPSRDSITASCFGRVLLSLSLPIDTHRSSTERSYRGIRLVDGDDNILSS